MDAVIAFGPRKPPPAAAFIAPEGVSDHSFSGILLAVAGDVVSSFSDLVGRRRDARFLVRRIRLLLSLFEAISDSRRPLSRLAVLCLKEFYIVLHRARVLLDYIAQGSRLWLLLRDALIAEQFQELDREISTLLDIMPLDEFHLVADVREHVDLLRRQVAASSRRGMLLDYRNRDLKVQILSFLNKFEMGQTPDEDELKHTFVDRMGISGSKGFEWEIEFLENEISNHEDDDKTDWGIISGVIALVRYCRFLLFGLRANEGKKKTSPATNSASIPKDFCCPISLDLMRDPVVVSTGQTYDRDSISQWLDAGNRTCPNSGQFLGNAALVPNRALRSLITRWCAAKCLFNEGGGISGSEAGIATKAAVEANRATARILIWHLWKGDDESMENAAHELRMLAKIGKENRKLIAGEGAIPLLRRLLHSTNGKTQENAVTALLNLSIQYENKRRIMEEERCLSSIVEVLRRGMTAEARENAAAALFSLSAVHNYKKKIVEEAGGLEGLAELLRKGRPRGRKDAAMALFNLATHPESWGRMVGSGAMRALVGALGDDEVAEEAAGAVGRLAREPVVAGLVGWEDRAVVWLAGVMRTGSSRGRENAAAALHEICRSGGEVVAERVARVPGVSGVVQAVAMAGTNRARRKAAALAMLLQRRETVDGGLVLRGTDWAVEQIMRSSGRVAPFSVANSVAVL